MRAYSVFFGVAFFAGGLGATGVADTLVPIDQQRSVHTMVNASQCNGNFFFDDDEAAAFEPFGGAVESEHICDFGFAQAQAEQQSEIGPRALSGDGRAASQAGAGVLDVIHAISNSYYEVRFRLDDATPLRLRGTFSAAGELPDVGVSAGLRLHGPGGVAILDQRAEPGPNGEPTTLDLATVLTLAPGEYVIRADGFSVIDAIMPPGGEGLATFDFRVAVVCPGDVDGDDQVDLADLTTLLAHFGVSEGATLDDGDLDADGDVDLADLAALLASFGQVCV